jgi:hypothetical protein
MDALAVDFDRLGVEVDHEVAGLNDRLGVSYPSNCASHAEPPLTQVFMDRP